MVLSGPNGRRAFGQVSRELARAEEQVLPLKVLIEQEGATGSIDLQRKPGYKRWWPYRRMSVANLGAGDDQTIYIIPNEPGNNAYANLGYQVPPLGQITIGPTRIETVAWTVPSGDITGLAMEITLEP